MFNSWLQLIFSSCFIFLFCGLAIKAGMTFLNGILTISIANADELNLISTGAQAGVAGAFMASDYLASQNLCFPARRGRC